MLMALRPRVTWLSIHSRWISQAEGVAAVLEPVAGVGDFDSPIRQLFPQKSRWPPRGNLPHVRYRRIVLRPPRSPVQSRAGPCPPAAAFEIEIRKFGFKTFNSSAPFFAKRAQRNVPPLLSSSAPTGVDLPHQGGGF